MAGENRTKMSLAPVRDTAEAGWHRIQGPYDSGYIRQIVDPANVPLKRVLTAIPSPFARIHLFEAAFASCKGQQVGTSEFHRMVSECLDVLELLHGLEDQAQEIMIVPWNAADNLPGLMQSPEPGQKLLAETLKLFLRDDGVTANFALQPVFYELIVQNEVLAVSSPLTLFFTSPRAGEIAERQHLIHPDTQKPYFKLIQPLHERNDDFQIYLHKLFLTPPAPGHSRLSKLCEQMYEYLRESISLLQALRSPLANTLLGLYTSDQPPNQSGTPILDKNDDPLSVLGFDLYKGPSKQKQRLEGSPIILRSSLPNAGKPLVWTGLTDSYGVSQTASLPAPADLPPLDKRILPDLGIRYPFICAADFIEDRLVKVPFAANSHQFHVPSYEGFPKDLDQSFLLPLKQAFFRYFPPAAIPSMATFTRLPKGDGVLFKLEIPVRAKTLRFERAYYDSPQGDGRGKIVSAAMNLAIFPFVSIAAQPQFSDRYWAMLVDDERGGVLQSRDDVFLPTFFKLKNGTTEQFSASPKEEDATLKVRGHVRSTKASRQAGSTYFRLTGGRCDLIQIAAFGTDAERQGTGMIAPAWVDREPGTREARIAIDFGTTNTHMALRLDTENPMPFTVDAGSRQVALLSSETYNDYPSNIPGTTIRLFHEFIPSIIGGTSRFHFPLRTATSEQPNLVTHGFKPLQSVNISFTHGIEVPLPEEKINTRLKWSVDADPLVSERIEAFVEELLLLMRTKLLLLDVDLKRVILTWFRPMSFTRATRSRFDEIWQRKCEEILGMPSGRVTSLTESEAPFYYHFQRGMVASEHTICVDIGGGSTDVVFFKHDKPRFGTSFTFAGNELWGNGYAEVEQGETGIVRSLRGGLGELLAGAPDTLKQAFGKLVESNASSTEIMNFCFGADAQMDASKFLSDKSSVKCLALIHYAAILYHCAQLMKSNGMSAPEILCFSGRGSKYLDILERHPEKRYTGAIAKAIFEHVYGKPIAAPVSLQFARDGKEATCNGGLLKELKRLENGNVQYEESLPSMPNTGDGSIPSAPPLTGQIDDAMISSVAANYRNFVEMLIALSTRQDIHFKECLEITFPPDLVKSVLTQKVEETIRRGVQSRQPHAKEDPISETLFFYPLVQNLFELGVRLS